MSCCASRCRRWYSCAATAGIWKSWTFRWSTLDRHPVCEQSDIIVVESDNVRGGYLAARELLRSGCRRIAFLTDSLKTSTKRSRYKGYVRALHQAGLEASDSLVISVGHQEEQQVRERIRQVLAQDPLIDGILCATDRLAIGAILGAQDCGRRIPEDLCVTGFDDGADCIRFSARHHVGTSGRHCHGKKGLFHSFHPAGRRAA